AHPKRGSHCAFWCREGCHHRIADRFYDRATFGRDDFVEQAEMCAHQVVCYEIADTLIKFGRTFEIGKEKRQARDLEPLIYRDCVSAIDIAKCLIAEQPLRREERPSSAEQIMQLVACNPESGQSPPCSTVLQKNAHWSRPHLRRCSWSLIVGHDERQ